MLSRLGAGAMVAAGAVGTALRGLASLAAAGMAALASLANGLKDIMGGFGGGPGGSGGPDSNGSNNGSNSGSPNGEAGNIGALNSADSPCSEEQIKAKNVCSKKRMDDLVGWSSNDLYKLLKVDDDWKKCMIKAGIKEGACDAQSGGDAKPLAENDARFTKAIGDDTKFLNAWRLSEKALELPPIKAGITETDIKTAGEKQLAAAEGEQNAETLKKNLIQAQIFLIVNAPRYIALPGNPGGYGNTQIAAANKAMQSW
jgi:hypothetical protein